MSTEHSPASPAAAVGPRITQMDTAAGREAFFYDLYPTYAAEMRWGPLGTEAATEAERRLFAQTQAVSLDSVAAAGIRKLLAERLALLEACEAAIRYQDQYDRGGLSAEQVDVAMRSAVAKAHGLRPCDVPALVPEVLQAQPQCVHGEKTSINVNACPVHGQRLSTERHDHNGGLWYTYVCDGYLEEQRESGG